MAAHQIKVSIGKDGSTEIAVVGYPGAKCKDITKTIEKALGKVTDDQKTDDFYKKEVVQRQDQKLG